MNMRRFFQLFVLLLLILPIYATDFVIPRLSPLPVKVENQKIPLSGKWQFNPSPEKNFGRNNRLITGKILKFPVSG